MTDALAKMDLTASQGHIMGFLSKQPSPPCARDIEEALGLSHPTVSGLLSRLEKKGFLEFRPDQADRRCKRICILPKGRQCLETMDQTILSIERRLVRNFTEEEQIQFGDYLNRAIANVCPGHCKLSHKEETD